MQEVLGEVVMLVEEDLEEMYMEAIKMLLGEQHEETRGARLIVTRIACVHLGPLKIRLSKGSNDRILIFLLLISNL